MMPTCLITGADGLLGTHLIPLLEDYELYVVTKRDVVASSFSNRCHVVHADLTEEKFCEALPEKVDAVIHLAQSNNFRMFPEKALDIAGVNTFGTVRLLDYAKRAGARHFIYASTGGVYQAGSGSCREEEALTVHRHSGMYYASKLAGELFVDAYSQLMATAVLRFFFIYGPGQRRAMLIPRLVQSVIDGNPITLQGENGMHLNPVYATDAARAVRAALQLSSSAVVNIAGSEVLSLKEIGVIIGEAVGREPVFQKDLSKEPLDLVADVEKMKQMLVEPEVNFHEGLTLYLQEAFPDMVRG